SLSARRPGPPDRIRHVQPAGCLPGQLAEPRPRPAAVLPVRGDRRDPGAGGRHLQPAPGRHPTDRGGVPMNPTASPLSADNLATALTNGGSGWLLLSPAGIPPLLWGFPIIMPFPRPYILRFLGTLTLRFGGDVWWLSYVLMRDALLTITLALSVIFLMPNLYIGLGLPLTAPLATVVLLWAMVVKLIGDADDDGRTFQIVSVLMVIASVLYIVPQIYGLESADQVDALKGIGLDWVPGGLSAIGSDGITVNPLAWPILDVSLVLFGLTAAYLFIRFVMRLGRGREVSSEAGS